MKRRTRLTRVSAKERRIASVWRRVKRQIRARGGGRCEVILPGQDFFWLWMDQVEGYRRFRFIVGTDGWRCENPAKDGHHIRKPRRAHMEARWCLDVCRQCHDWFDAWHGEPRGKLMADPVEDGGAPRCWIRRTDKFEARRA